MSQQTMAEALRPLKAKMPKSVREQEILRVVVDLSNSPNAKHAALKQILFWAQRRCGGRLPENAWSGDSFEYLVGGRTTFAISLLTDETDVWALRADDPDEKVPGRSWTTEVSIGRLGNAAPRMSVRLSVNTVEETLVIEPSVPGFLLQLADRCGLEVGGFQLFSYAQVVSNEADVSAFLSLLEHPKRRLPVIVATGDARSEFPNDPLINAQRLAKGLVGLAHVVVLPAAFTYALSDEFGKMRSVFHGGVRVYMPGFSADSNPHEHRLFLANSLRSENEARECETLIRRLAAYESLLRWRLSKDVLSFGLVKATALNYRELHAPEINASEAQRLESAKLHIELLEDELQKTKNWEDQLTKLCEEAENRATSAEAQLRGSIALIQTLRDALRQSDAGLASKRPLPTNWEDFGDWCDEELIGCLVLSQSARRGIRKPEFEDVQLAARCLVWLASECRNRRIDGGGSLSEFPIEEGVRNAACGGDEYVFEYQGQRITADWHIKNGGNTRDPKRCLRIYYGWDAQTLQIVVSHMPAHRITDAS